MYTLPDRSYRSTPWKTLRRFLVAWGRPRKLSVWPAGFPLQLGYLRPCPGPSRSIRALVRHYSPPSSLSTTARMQCSLTTPFNAVGIFKYISWTDTKITWKVSRGGGKSRNTKWACTVIFRPLLLFLFNRNIDILYFLSNINFAL